MLNPDFFALFGLQERFGIDPQALTNAYRAIQSSVHPDRFVRAMDSERRLAMQMSTHANEAYRVLGDPVQRALYLCARHGVAVDGERGMGMDTEFLEQQMDWRETLEDASRAGDRAELARLQALLRENRAQALGTLAQALDEERDYPRAAAIARRLMFVDKFETSVTAADRALAAQSA